MGNQRSDRNEKVKIFRWGEELVLIFTQPHELHIPVTDRQAIDNEVIRMLKIRTAEW